MTSDYRPREHDHLVEPMFGGLGIGEEKKCRAWGAGLRRFLRRLADALLGAGPRPQPNEEEQRPR